MSGLIEVLGSSLTRGLGGLGYLLVKKKKKKTLINVGSKKCYLSRDVVVILCCNVNAIWYKDRDD